NFREWNGMTSEGFDGLIDDQRESVATLRQKLADSFMDGHLDKDGNIIVVDALSWSGMRNDARVEQVDLGAAGVNFDFTDQAQTFATIEANFKEVRDIMWITNNCQKELTYYVSREIASNFERNSSESYSSEKILNRLAQLMGVTAIKPTSKLTGNQMMGFPLDSSSISPIVGMGINTVAMPRPVYNSNYEFAVWGAIGFEVRQDFAGNTCAFYASA
ncbi:MAG: phage coat protein, partial [Candidatus Aminicenantes bacterium]|nr:phage coat protein [Candidatus Aminicenantes bacterium]